MDYKYIEQLLERYWECNTSVEEEKILRSFFSQKDVPAHLEAYKDLFAFEESEKQIKLGDDFDARILEKIEQPKTRIINFKARLTPLFRAAAVVAIIITLGNAAQHSFNSKSSDNDYNYDSYQDTYKDPNVAYDKVSSALMLVSEGINKSQAQINDSLNRAGDSVKSVNE